MPAIVIPAPINSNHVAPVAAGGTGASTAANARTNLDVYSKSEVTSAIAQSTANTQLSPSYDTSKIESITAYRNGRIVFVSMRIAAGALPAGYSYIQCNLGVSFVAQPNIVFCSQGTADDAKVFGGYFLQNTLQIRASASNSAGLLATFVGITS